MMDLSSLKLCNTRHYSLVPSAQVIQARPGADVTAYVALMDPALKLELRMGFYEGTLIILALIL